MNPDARPPPPAVPPGVPPGYLGAEGRITSGPAPELVAAGYELETADAPLLHHGLGLADVAHAVALAELGVVPPAEAARLLGVLVELLATPAEEFPYDATYGDAYNSRERELARRLGPTAGWLPAGRTRREAGRIAFRLALRERLLDLHAAVAGLAGALAGRAVVEAGTVWADTTYLQPAQPSTFGHFLGAFAEESARHLDRLRRAHAWADASPAGAGGVGGTRVPLDRDRLAGLLGFAAVAPHTRDAMWAVDGLADAVMAAVLAAVTADRLAEDLEVFASPPFGYVRLDPSLCRASVLMPQKRNPYALAVVRGGAGTLIGRLTGLLATARTPSARTDNWLYAYGEVTGAIDLARRLVELTTAVVATLEIDRQALAAAAGTGFTAATDLADELVLAAGLDYRSAYRVVAAAVAAADRDGRAILDAVALDRAAEQVIGRPVQIKAEVVAAALDPAAAARARPQAGGSSPARVREHAARVQAELAEAGTWERGRRAAAEAAERRLLELAGRLAADVTGP